MQAPISQLYGLPTDNFIEHLKTSDSYCSEGKMNTFIVQKHLQCET